MAYERMEVVKEIETSRDGSGKLRISAGENSVDIRNYYKSESGEWLPTKRGIRMSKETLTEVIGDLMKMVEPVDLEDIIEEIGILED